MGDRPQIGAFRVCDDDQVMAGALLVSKKEVLAVRRLDVCPMDRGVLDCGDRRMLVALVFDAEPS